MGKKTTIGGQALIEGIMMKGPRRTVLAVRSPDKSIDVFDMKETHIKEKFSFLGWPVIRGAVNFIEAMILGYKALMLSAEKSGFTDIEDTTQPEQEKEASKEEKKQSLLMNVLITIASVLGIAIAVVLFMWVPVVMFNLINNALDKSITVWRSLVEGVIKIAIFVGYVCLTTLAKDIKRVFMYHGAEHKTIFCYESGQELTIENVKKNTRYHPRCGTSFMFVMLFLGIVINGFLSLVFAGVTKITVLWVAIKILVLPVVCGIGYELIKYCGRHENIFTKIVSTPGLWMQRITTKEPEDDMIEVAIEAIKQVIPQNSKEDCW